MTQNLSHNRLIKVLHYDEVTGIFTRRSTSKICGWPNPGGYLQIMIDCRIYQLHRLAFFYMTGKWPVLHVDHINCMRSDNRWCNLRQATYSQNRMNAKNLNHGLKGAHFWDRKGLWRARYGLGGKS
jgi:hypothetical protein